MKRPTKLRMASMVGLIVLAALAVSRIGGSAVPGNPPAVNKDALKLPASEPMGTLQSAPADQKSQAQALHALIRELRFYEDLQQQGDTQVSLTAGRSELSYSWLLAEKRDTESVKTGTTVEVPDKQQYLAPKTTRVRWAHKDYMFYIQSQITPDSQNKFVGTDNTVVSYDGKHLYRYWLDRREGTMVVAGRKEESSAISSLTLSTYGSMAFSDLLKAPGTVYEGVQKIGDATCRKVVLSKGGGTVEIWFSISNGYRAKRVTYTRKPQPKGHGAYVVREVSGFKRYGHTWFPTGGWDVWYRTDERGHKDWVSYNRWSLISYDPAVSGELFTLAFPKGTNVADMTASDSTVRHFVAGADSGNDLTADDGANK